ncbi:probable cation-transporting ATPase 13A4 [Microcaecilia unicolor]|uniref:Cation-transporting ATPase n=1 Tax=Microcaecilia unicolor TaxID=1415580 RepID=A0A6P7YWP7_9AMPH|nr:probable cation-transporting ATPase 13A4 [Microcaecilia unicolor]
MQEPSSALAIHSQIQQGFCKLKLVISFALQEIFGYRTHGCRRALCIAGSILSLGFLLLLFYWKPEWDVRANCVPCSLEEADTVLLRTTDQFKQCCKKKVNWIHLSKLTNSVVDKPNLPITADENSIINRAIMRPELKVRYIWVQKIKYIWLSSEKQFRNIGALEDSNSCSDIYSKYGSGLTREEQDIRREICGSNAIDVEVTPIWKILFKEVLNPFYIIQAASLALWLSQGYTEFSIAIIIITVLSIILTTIDLRRQSVKLNKLVKSNNSIKVDMCRKDGECIELESQYLVPGDIIVLTGKRLFLPCDTILLSGTCVVNEGTLTGESIPVFKIPLPRVDNAIPWKIQTGEDYKKHILFCGTEVIQIKTSGHGPVKAVVLQTGFNTAKGDMVRSILYPKPVNFQLYKDVFRFILCLLALAAFGLIYAVIIFKIQGESVREIIVKALLLCTIAVSPTLPAALALAVIYANIRLKRKGILCISPQRINICGRLNLLCFDKTGTLTEDGLDLWGVIPSAGDCFLKVHKFSSGNALPWGPLLGAMASCHSLIVLDGKVQGDPLDLKMFEGTNWEIDISGALTTNQEQVSEGSLIIKPGPKASNVTVEGISILHQFPFSSSMQRMSVIAELMGEDEVVVFMKGAPEKVVSFCKPETVPNNFAKELEHYTLQGFRVIALAFKNLNIRRQDNMDDIVREEVECDLEFLGLLIMENRLKEETVPVLQELSNAKLRTVMITGDNLQTAVTVARNSGIIPKSGKVILVEALEPEESTRASITWQPMEDPNQNGINSSETFVGIEKNSDPTNEMGNYYFAMSGKSYEAIVKYFYNLLPKLLLNGAIFARMSPNQKSNLIEEFQKLNYYVSMCGDGANDCGALKVAHAGISLSEQEASVASPFTSQTPNIECVAHLVKEGRAALVSSFCVFKYITLYSMIQFCCLLLLYWQTKILGMYQYLIQDFGVTFSICLTMSLNCAYPKLAPYRPLAQLISPPLMLSVIFNILLNLSVQICGFVLVQQQPWYSTENYSACSSGNGSLANSTNSANEATAGDGYDSFETTTLFLLTTINCIIVAFVFSKGKPFRQPIYTNYVFLILLTVQLAVCIFILFANIEDLYKRLELVCTPTIWRVAILIMLIILFVISFTVEETIIENRSFWRKIKECVGYHSKSQYRILLSALATDPSWPPLYKTEYADAISTQTDGKEAYMNPAYEEEILVDGKQDTDIAVIMPSAS